MTLGPREVMRSEAVDGLTGPANPIPDESLDCGCGQLPCPKLAKYATRKLFITLLCWIGFIQASAAAYFALTSSTIARRFQFEPNTMEWLSLGTDGLIPFLIALPVAYWGDRIHRTAWTGALVLIQSAGYLALIIPHFTHPSTRIIEETTNVTHLSLYAEDNPELCTQSGLARISIIEETTCYITLGIIVVVLIVNCMGNVGFYALGISYLDDNTRKRSVAFPIAIILGVRIFGILFGYLLAWGCLRIDAENLTEKVETYKEQIGAWWLGWIILAFLLAIPGVPMSWLPRRLPSEVIEQAAASIVDGVGRTSPLSESTISDEAKRVGDAGYFSSLRRLMSNKILLCNIFASIFCMVALINFANNEDIILESMFYVARPSGSLLGFGDPLTSRIIATVLRPIVIGIVIIISGIIITKCRPRPKWLVGYSIIVLVIAATMILSLAFVSCEKAQIAGSNRKGSIPLPRYCYSSKECRCSRNANFHPICDSQGSRIFYTPCHAGCTGIDDSGDVRKYTGCSCIKELLGLIDTDATEGPCASTTCQIGWIVFEVSTIIAYSLVSSAAVSTVLIALRSTYWQDKALAIGLWISLSAMFIYIPGKLLYWTIADITCIHRGTSSSLCHLHDSTLGSYVAYLTAFLLVLGVVFEVLTLVFSRALKIYRDSESNRYDSALRPEQVVPLMLCPLPAPERNSDDPHDSNENITAAEVNNEASNFRNEENLVTAVADSPRASRDLCKATGPLKFGPLGPGNPRITMADLQEVKLKHVSDSDDDDSDDDHIHDRKAPISLMTIQYKRLEMDSDLDTSDSSPPSRKRISTLQRSAFELAKPVDDEKNHAPGENTIAGFSKTNDIEFTRWENKDKQERRYTGDFNEVGIPIVDYAASCMSSRSIGSILGESARQKNEKADWNFRERGRETNRALSPVEHASSGFGSCSSDLHKITESSAPTSVRETSENEESNGKPSVVSKTKRTKPSYSTAL